MDDKEKERLDYILLKSLLEGKKFLHMGRTPVWAIDRAFSLDSRHLVTIDEESWVSITEEGKKFVAEKGLAYLDNFEKERDGRKDKDG